MQTILGSNGQIGQELANELYRHFTKDLRLVSRHPQALHETDQLVPADLLDARATKEAILGSEVVYFTAGMPMNSGLMEQQFPVMIQNVIDACQASHSKLVFFDNTYMYPKTAALQSEDTPFEPNGRKSALRAKVTSMILNEIKQGRLEAVICRAPEFYGPGKTKSISNTLIFNRLKQGQRALIPISKATLRTLIWTPDASRAMALIGNTPDAYNQTWHLPCAEPITYQAMLKLAQPYLPQQAKATVLPLWLFKLASHFNPQVGELMELLPRYQVDNRFSSAKFKTRFPEFKITDYQIGIQSLLANND